MISSYSLFKSEKIPSKFLRVPHNIFYSIVIRSLFQVKSQKNVENISMQPSGVNDNPGNNVNIPL